MKTLTDTLARLTPPPWLVLALAAAMGAALLAAFVDILQENVRRGEEMRLGQRVGLVRHPIGAVATALQDRQPPQLATSISPQLQR